MKKKYCITVVRTGCMFVEAEGELEAMDIANHQPTNAVSWSDDWEATDCVEDDTILKEQCIREKAFN